MDEAFSKLLMVALVCCTISIFFIASCVSKEKASLTNEEKALIQLQDAYTSCQNRTSEEDHCLAYLKTLKELVPPPPKAQEPTALTANPR